MNPVLLQKQLKENATDLQDFYKDLKLWGDAMNRKEDAAKGIEKMPKSSSSKKPKTELSNGRKIPATKTAVNPKTKIGTTDYSAWDKFDADAECEKVDFKEDNDSESELSDEIDSSQREVAFLEKEKGNTLVRKQQWHEAIRCYTKAIDYYSFDPIFYANRALCYLKTNSMDKAEMDCTLSLKLDRDYVKAYQRRAAAREAQNKLQDAEDDLIKVLELEPNNKESKKAFDNLRLKLGNKKEATNCPVSKFAASRKQTLNHPAPFTSKTAQVDTSSPTSVWKNDGDVIQVRVVNKPPHLRSKKPLKRLLIEEIDGTTTKPEPVAFSAEIIENKPNIVELTGPVDTHLSKIDRVQEMAGKNLITEMSTEIKNELNEAPKNSVQFYSTWKQFENLDLKYDYLKLIQPREIPNIFKECLESDVLSEILQVLETCFVKNKDGIYDILANLCKVKRFSTFTMFMSHEDKKRLWKLIDYIKDEEKTPKDDVAALIKIYEL